MVFRRISRTQYLASQLSHLMRKRSLPKTAAVASEEFLMLCGKVNPRLTYCTEQIWCVVVSVQRTIWQLNGPSKATTRKKGLLATRRVMKRGGFTKTHMLRLMRIGMKPTMRPGTPGCRECNSNVANAYMNQYKKCVLCSSESLY
jgi:hypothetical protein